VRASTAWIARGAVPSGRGRARAVGPAELGDLRERACWSPSGDRTSRRTP
jgi:hypothetical protein